MFISPRGLISILLFLQIGEVAFLKSTVSIIDQRVLLIVILTSMVIMTKGTMKKDTEKEETEETEMENLETEEVFTLDDDQEEIQNNG